MRKLRVFESISVDGCFTDANGDMSSKVVSIYQVKYDTNYPPGDVVHQFKYVGVAPEA